METIKCRNNKEIRLALRKSQGEINLDLREWLEEGVYLTEATVEGGVYLSGATVKGRVYLDGASIKEGIIDSAAPQLESLDAKILAAIAGGKLEQQTWHTCKTTHCRAGWAIIVAGEQGALLEKRLGPPAAAAALYTAAGLPIPDFYNMNNEEVLAQIKDAAARS